MAITFLPGTVTAGTPSDAPPLPEWIEPFPTNWSSMASPGLELDRVKSEQHRARFSAQASVSASRVGNDVSLGVPVVASIELARGKRIGYLLDSRGRVAGKIIAKLAAPEADLAIRHYQQGSNHYYLLDWGPLARPARQ